MEGEDGVFPRLTPAGTYFSKKKPLPLAGNGFLTANYVLSANHHPAPLWKGMIIPIIIMTMFAMLNASI
ncbi:hypothetical protein D4S03_05695 [bacterium]|nr:MAG: hypothetical protein D4S03_05695 [bacterium]